MLKHKRLPPIPEGQYAARHVYVASRLTASGYYHTITYAIAEGEYKDRMIRRCYLAADQLVMDGVIRTCQVDYTDRVGGVMRVKEVSEPMSTRIAEALLFLKSDCSVTVLRCEQQGDDKIKVWFSETWWSEDVQEIRRRIERSIEDRVGLFIEGVQLDSKTRTAVITVAD